jgi:hypothetical protein
VAAVRAAAAGELPDPWREPPKAFDSLPVRRGDEEEEPANI